MKTFFSSLRSLLILSLLSLTLCGLPKVNLDINETTVSGLSSGAFMAVQLHFAYSNNIKGAAVFAGGPYYCAQGQMTGAMINCMSMPMAISVPSLISSAKSHASSGLIDSLENLKSSKVYLFSGKSDSVVKQDVQKKNEDM
jgi:predicted esterase